MHWIIIGVKPAYCLKLFWTMWCPEFSLSMCNEGSVLYPYKNEEICMALFHIRFFSVFSLYFALLQHVGHKCMGHMYVTMTSVLINGSTGVTHFQLWIWYSFWYENLWGYQDNFIYEITCCYSKDSQNLEVFWIIVVHYRLHTLYY